jgi:hypothetical protein
MDEVGLGLALRVRVEELLQGDAVARRDRGQGVAPLDRVAGGPVVAVDRG